MASSKLIAKIRSKAWLWCGLCFSVLLLSAASARAQSFSDLFGQGKKELKNMALQIAALNAFQQSAWQGYQILHNEWSAIGNWKNGELGLHQTYYTSLSQVNPVVKSDPDIGSLQSEQEAIVELWNAAGHVPGLQPGEQSYVQRVRDHLLKDCSADLRQLQQLLQNGSLTMSDDERLKGIARLQADMLDKYWFTQGFCNSVRLLVVQRNAESNEVSNLNPFYESN